MINQLKKNYITTNNVKSEKAMMFFKAKIK